MHPHADLMHRLFDAFGRRDGVAVAAMFDRGIVWRVGGGTSMSGEYRGWREVLQFLRRTTQETDGTYRSALVWAAGDERHAAAIYRARGMRDGDELDIEQLLLCEVVAGRITHATAIPFDADAFTRFWS